MTVGNREQDMTSRPNGNRQQAMSAKELKLNGGLTDLRVNEIEEFLAFTIQTRPSFKGDTTMSSMLVVLDQEEQHLLMLYLQERLGNPAKPLALITP